ncbi:unnamed protein product [Cylindrotheca closterium]|uniref:ADP,ATP carrier protein n=1 Tax=Cylindrotheca closterium TaxID=2856 RepID=A0AAD2FIQ8_9STRA|nr:unnamed protein product [Cylindrotheca closterium]
MTKNSVLGLPKRILSCLSMMALLMLSTTPVQAEGIAGAAVTKSALSAALKDIDLRYFIAGGTCAAFSHGITTPIDVVKTKIQADPKKYQDKNMLAVTKDIVQTEGAGALLTGLGPTIVGYGVEGAMKFGVYEVSKPILKSLLASLFENSNTNTEPFAFLLSSILAGAIAAVLLCPMESLRIKQVTDESFQNESLLTGLPKLIEQDGFLSLFGGVLAMLAKQVPYTFGKQVSFDVLATFFYQFYGNFLEIVNKWLVSISAAACASLAACLLSQPGDMILTETYSSTKAAKKKKKRRVAEDPASSTKPFGVAVGDIYQRGGSGEFFRGLSTRILHVGMIITSQLVVYDIVKQMLGLPATGSH